MNEYGFGLYEVIGIAAVLIVAAFVVIPGFRNFAQGIMNQMDSWVNDSIIGKIFPAS
jgi:Na+-translocating ferredoxin:NAD+ oxidoreductase RnfE subunit